MLFLFSFHSFPPSVSSGLAGERGMSLLELVVTIGLVGVLIAVAVPRLNSSALNMAVTTQNLIGDLRLARAYATSRGAHYRVTISSDSYSVRRLQDTDGDGVWEPDGAFPARDVALPPNISIGDGAGAAIEFDTRGLMADQPDGTPAAIVAIHITDAGAGGQDEDLEVWPSGQVQEV